MIHIYIDAEFDAVRINQKFRQMVISLGAVMVDDEGKQIDEYYSLVRPYSFKRLSTIVKKMTKLNNEMILNARKLPEVEKEFKEWVYAKESDRSQICLYSFGPDDGRTLRQNCGALSLDKEEFFHNIIDLQKAISPKVCHDGEVISSTLSLDDMKMAYDIAGAVDHNALSDARDLMYIHQAVLKGKTPNPVVTQEIYERKVAKQKESEERQRKRLSALMKERFGKFPNLHVPIHFYPEVVEQFQLWDERDRRFLMHWKTDGFTYDGHTFSYEDTAMMMDIDIEAEVPMVHLFIETADISLHKEYELTYRNATMIENICKRLKK